MAKKKSYTNKEGFCILCGTKGVDIHHIKTRGSGGSDEYWNMVELCHPHHQELHTMGNLQFSKEYGEYEFWLIKNGWEICELTGKWFRPHYK